MVPSDACYNLIKRFESFQPNAYLDPEGIPTIGYGHTYGVVMGFTCTQVQADDWLKSDVSLADSFVGVQVKVPLTQGQFDALTSFVFNCGIQAFAESTLLRKLNAGDYAGAAAEFPRWVHGNGMRVLAGLVTRRATERILFETGTLPAPGKKP
jgi:lysozyme